MIEDITKLLMGFLMKPKYTLKDKTVKFRQNEYFTDDFFKILNGYLTLFFEAPEIIITSAFDGVHTPKSLHYQKKAIDIRIRHLVDKFCGFKTFTEDWNGTLMRFSVCIANALPDYYLILSLNPNNPYIHIQYSRENIREDNLFTEYGKYHNLYVKE